MNNQKIGFIGCGNMATAIMKGLISNNIYTANDIVASDASMAAADKIKTELGVAASTDNINTVEDCGILVLAVKPQYYETVIVEIRDSIKPEQIIITIAPGKTIAWLEEKFAKPVKLVRTMPNTPALVGAGMTGACRNKNINDEEYKTVFNILGSFGIVETITENLMNVCVSVSGSSPAYVYILIEAMADAAVADGMPRDKAYKFAAQAVLGSAQMVLETGKHPGELKDMVCSPGGTTIEAVRVLEERGFRSAVFEAMKACVRKARDM